MGNTVKCLSEVESFEDSEQNGLPEDRYFSFYITHKGLPDHKAA